jgi:alpha-galactosidase
MIKNEYGYFGFMHSKNMKAHINLIIHSVLTLSLFLITESTAQTLYANPLKLTITIPQSTQPIIIQGNGTYIESRWASPQTNLPLQENTQWKHEKREEFRKVLAGKVGRLISDEFSADGLMVNREVWISADKDEMAIRQKICNRSTEPIYLKALMPVYCEDNQGMIISNESNAENWDVLIQQRLKNGRPATSIPSESEKYEIDQFVLFNNRNELSSPVLLIGYLSQMEHCARMWMQFEKKNDAVNLDQFMTECEFDNCLIPQDGERTSQWVFIKLGNDPNKLIADYADRVGIYHGVKKPPKNAPSVFCTWYFHGYYYNETFFHQDLAALKEDHLPFDVFLIDECWSLHKWGDFQAIESWPSGMKDAADRIRTLGYKPGIWSCPYLVDFKSVLAEKHPEWLLKDEKGETITFTMNKIDHWVLDLTFPGVCDFLEETYRKLAHDWGYEYFKFDFMRSVFLQKGQRFYDPTKTRLEAYHMGLEAIRRGTGPDAYLAVCGGHYGGSLGIANSQRSGSDVVSIWRSKEIPKFRQNILRTWMSRLWHVDPDAMMVRKREERFHSDRELSLGLLTDDEARTIALNQYIAGGLITFTEFMPELGDERKALYRHVIPPVNASSIPLDIFDPLCPSKMVTEVNPKCSNLGSWVTVAMINWTDEVKNMSLDLSQSVLKSIPGSHFLVFEFFSQKIIGIYEPDDVINLSEVAAHHSRLLRIVPWDGVKPVLAGTDLHFSGGAVEIASWKIGNRRIEGEIETIWDYPVTVTAAFPATTALGYIEKSVEIRPGQRLFSIEFPE